MLELMYPLSCCFQDQELEGRFKIQERKERGRERERENEKNLE